MCVRVCVEEWGTIIIKAKRIHNSYSAQRFIISRILITFNDALNKKESFPFNAINKTNLYYSMFYKMHVFCTKN